MTRRVVTGHDETGASIVVADGEAPRTHVFENIPGMVTTLLWSTSNAQAVPHRAGDPTSTADYLPQRGETRAMMVTFPPDAVFMSEQFDGPAAAEEQLRANPGLAERFEPDQPGMHTTDSVDYGLVVQGQVILELDGGRTVMLTPGDVVVQNGTRHAWRNPGDSPATVMFVLVGAAREQ